MRPAILLLLLALSVAACDGGSNAFNRLPQSVVAARDVGIVEINLASGDERLLLPVPDDAFLREPAVSPDGTRLAYTREILAVVLPDQPFDAGSDVFVANIDGSEPRLVREHGARGELVGAPSWLPDGDLLVSFQRFDVGAFVSGVERVDVETGATTPVLDDAFAASATPDGEQIVFLRVDEEFLQSLWLANVDGSDASQLLGRGENFGSFHSPRMSPDGTTIAVAAGELLEAGVTTGGPVHARPVVDYNGLPADVYLVDVATGEHSLLADLDLDSPSLAWSGDGDLVFVLSGDGLIAIDPVDGSQLSLAEGTFHGQLDWLASEGPES